MVAPNRRERRSEGRPVIIAVILVTVAVVSFALGFMAGRGRAPEPAAEPAEPAASAPRHPIATVTPPPAPEAPVAAAPAPAATTEPPPAGDKLTFFDTLPKGEQPPLGSGINLPPGETAASAPAPAEKPAPVPAPAAASKPAPAPKPAATPTKTATAKAETGPFILQVSSSRNPDEAGVLLGKLEKKGYQCSIQQADLGAKGVWYRVFVGPVANRADADALAKRLKSEMKIDALVRKQ